MKHRCNKPDLESWIIETFDDLHEKIKDAFNKGILHKAIEETLHYAFQDDNTYICFPAIWSKDPEDDSDGCDGVGGNEVDDPLTVYLRVGLDSEDDKPTYEFNLRDSLIEDIKYCAEDGSFRTGLRRISESLRKLADEIDVATESNPTKQLDKSNTQ